MKKIELEKVLRCADVSGTSCQFVARERTTDDILRQAGQHAVDGHGLTVTPELVEAGKTHIKKSERRAGGRRRSRPAASLESLAL